MGAMLACLATNLVCCCSSAACHCFSSRLMPKSSVATRVAYAVLFLLTSILAWTMQTGWIDNMLSSIPPGPQNPYDCPEKNCFSGNFAVARVLFSLSIFHILFGLIMLGVRNSKDFRAGIQNGWWGPKMVLLVGMIVASFFIPDSFFHSYSVLAFIGATFFIFIQLVLLIDFAANWSESWVRKWEDSGSKGWMVLLIGTGVSLGVLILVGTILFYVFFGRRGCSLNIFYITFNLLLSALAFALSINGRVQEARPSSGILQAGVVSLYATYLLGSALTSEGDERCNPFSEGGQQAATVFGTLFTFVAIAYSTSRAATRSNVLMGENTAPPETVFDGGIKDLEAAAPLLVNEAPAPTASMERSSEMAQQATAPTPAPAATTTSSSIPAAPKSADQELIEIGMAPDTSDKRRRLEEAVAAGSLPKSALEEDEDEDEAEGGRKALSREDERSGCNYNYSFYHAIFAVAAMYVTMLINKWSTVNLETGELEGVGHDAITVWVKVVAGWATFLLYFWTLVAPLVFPNREWA